MSTRAGFLPGLVWKLARASEFYAYGDFGIAARLNDAIGKMMPGEDVGPLLARIADHAPAGDYMAFIRSAALDAAGLASGPQTQVLEAA